MRVFLFALALVIAVLGCSDGKLNLLIVFWGDHEESSASRERPSSSSAEKEKPSSSSIIVEIPSSSSEYEPSSSSSEEEPPPSSSSEEPSSSSRGPRSSSAKTDSNGYTYEDYPTLEVGAPGVTKTLKTTRYWDGCKPMCSRPEHIGNPNPWAIAKTCDKNGYNEIPLFFVRDSNQWGKWYGVTPCAKEDNNNIDVVNWLKSQTYKDWVRDHPDFPRESRGYTCFNKAPYAVNDTLAYAFAAVNEAACGKCYRLQFIDEWQGDSKTGTDGDVVSKPRATHLALKGKTLIVMADNTGAGKDEFDIMIPGMGVGDYDCVHEQIGLPKQTLDQGGDPLGHRTGGLLAECVFPTEEDKLKYGRGLPSDRWYVDEWQNCLRDKCHRAFDRLKDEIPHLLEGCLWHVEWFKAADNPGALFSEVPCPKYLVDRYNSTVTTKFPDCYTSTPRTCQMDGMQSN